MTVPTVAVTCKASRQDGSSIAGAKFTARLNQTEIYNGFVVPATVTATADVNGLAVLNLWPNALGVVGSLYKITGADATDGRFLKAFASVPNAACDLMNILTDVPPAAIDGASQAVIDARAARDASGVSASASAASAAAALASQTASGASASTATAQAAAALVSLNLMKSQSYGPLSADPALDPLGNAPTLGDEYFNTTTSFKRVFRATGWANFEDVASTKAAEASTSAANAAASATAAGNSATAGGTSATNAAGSATAAASSASAASASETQALASKNAAATSETNAGASAGLAATAKASAEAARDAANVNGKVYATTAAGLAATTTTQYFSVPSADGAEHLILYLNNAGVAVEQKRYPSTTRLDQFLPYAALGYVYTIVDQDGVIALGIKTDAGGLQIPRRLLIGNDATFAPETPLGFAWAVMDMDGSIGCGIKSSGEFTASSVLANTLNGVPVSYYQTRAAQLGAFDAEINHFMSYGQSRSVGADSVPVITTAQRFDTLKFNGGVRAQDGGGTVAQNHTSLQPLTETEISLRGETPVAGATEFIKELILLENGISFTGQSYQLLGSAPGQSGTAIAGLISPTTPYQNVTSDISYGFSLAQAAGKTYKVRAFDWMQGESDYAVNTVGATYKAQLIQLRTDIANFAKTTTGQTEEVVCIQDQLCDHGSYGNANNPYIALIQLDLAKTQPFFYLSCPTYFATPGGVHHSASASKWIGAYHGLVYKRVVVDKVDWKPVSPVSAYRQGNIAMVKLNTPAPPLVIDAVSVPAQTNSGFSLVTAANVAITISSISLIQKDVVKIVAATAIPAGAKLRYGFGGIGNLRDSQGLTLVFDGGGLNKPMHNWCCIFEETLV